ncbi:uncharacterized protein LOC106881133 [Octopus bimaculoides]|uniref:J domain-containing protein n=1 Tax=Octopus bimaculoides TaxID=37653 RepID=A0A0L8FUA2_OCTBM|nr:uncharacterized protein LOC106881133 [Octopus bimaculoides]|eukprot:XP_014786889.1 PREDICTED: uncharacterized protein LOC106881133 [Octopus bimaculoides]
MALNNSQIPFRICLISHGFTGRSNFRSICPSKARYFDRRRYLQNRFYTSRLLHSYVSMCQHVPGLLINKQRCPYGTHWAITRNIYISQNKRPTAVNRLLYNRKCFSARFLSSKRVGRKFEIKSRNLFDVLEVTPRAHNSEIKKSFYRLSKRYHPDMNRSQEAVTKFAEISAAYEILKDTQKRRMYERELMSNKQISSEELRRHTSGSMQDHYNKHLQNKSQIKRRALKYDDDFWVYYGSMKDSRKSSHENLEAVLERYKEEERHRRAKGLLGGTVALVFLLTVMFWK